MIDPPGFEKVVGADPGVTDVVGSVVVVVVVSCPGLGVAVEVTSVVVVVVATVGLWLAVGNVVVVIVDAALRRLPEVDGLAEGPRGGAGEDDMGVVGTLHVVIAFCGAGEELEAVATAGEGMTGSGGEAIVLVTTPTPTQLTTVAAAVATTHTAIGNSLTRRTLQFSPPGRRPALKRG